MKTLLAALAFCLCALVGRAQTAGSFTLTSSLTVSNATVTVTGQPVIQFSPAKAEHAGILIMPTFSAENGGTSNVVFTFEVSPDGTTYTTTGPVTGTVAANGTNSVTGAFNVWPDELANIQYLKFKTVATTQTNLVTISAVRYFIVSP